MKAPTASVMIFFSGGVSSRCPAPVAAAATLFNPSSPSAVEDDDDGVDDDNGDPVQAASANPAARTTHANDATAGRSGRLPRRIRLSEYHIVSCENICPVPNLP